MRRSSPLLDDVVARFEDPKPNGTGIMVRCPCHKDAQQSLHISIGDDGRALLKCHAGCATADILTERGMTWQDLFPPKEKVAPRKQMVEVKAYDYHDERSTLLFQVVKNRYDDGSKSFSQRRPKPGGGWILNLDGVPRVPYGLPDLIKADPDAFTYLPEGEKDCDNVKKRGRSATTNAGGSGKWTDAHTEALIRIGLRRFAILLDNDLPGFRHALKIHRSLEGKAEILRIIRFDVAEKGDVSDWLDAGGKIADLDRIILQGETSIPGARLIEVDELARLAGESSAESAYVHCADDGDEDVQDFPVDIFPDAIARYITEGAESIGVPMDMIGLPFLGFAAGVIGNTVAVALKPGWLERPNLWIAIVGEPGCGKSPAVDYARGPVDALQSAAWKTYSAELVQWEIDVAAAKADKKNKDPLPDKPALNHFFTTDATTEALAGILSTSPGVTVARDELVGWVKSFDAYRQAGDRQSFLSLWAGAPLKVDRVGKGTTYVAHPCVPIVGGIQPELLSDLAEEANRRDGFVERVLMCWPVAQPQRWNDTSPSSATRWEVDHVFQSLRVRTDILAGETGVIHLTDEARHTFADWFNQNREIIESSTGVAAGCYSKYPGQVARIALVLHCLKHPGRADGKIDAETVVGAITLIEYLRHHLLKILPTFASVGSSKTAGLAPRILRILGKRDGEWVARRELRKGLGNSVPSDEITTALDLLAADGRVENRTVPTGARPREESRALHSHNAHMRNSTESSSVESAYVHISEGDFDEVRI